MEGKEKAMSTDERLKELIGDYWDLAYQEGKKGVDYDIDGKAFDKWSEILVAIEELKNGH